MTDPTMQAALRLRDLLPDAWMEVDAEPGRVDIEARLNHHQIAHLMALIPEGDDALALRLGRALLAEIKAAGPSGMDWWLLSIGDPHQGHRLWLETEIPLDLDTAADMSAWLDQEGIDR